MPKRKRNYAFLEYLIVVLIIVSLVALATNIPQNMACTEEAKLCPDGTAVGRVPPDCEFAPCPSACKCPSGYVQDGDVCNPSCYYSTPRCLAPSLMCSSVCNSDSDCVPEQCCHPTSCMNEAYKGVCNLACTASCEGLLDCGAGSCGCIKNRCVVVQA